MYTEENEFDYNEYVDENENLNPKKPFFTVGLFVKIILIILCLGLVIYLVFSIKNRNTKGNQKDPENTLLVFNNNVASLRMASEEYFFQNGNLPKEVGEIITVNINDLKDEKLLTEVKDENGASCAYNTSIISLVRNKNDYLLSIKLVCPSMEDSFSYYYDLEFNCLTCNGEEYTPSDENNDDKNEEVDNKDDNNIDDNRNDENPDDSNNNPAICKDFGDWTTEYIADTTLERETRTVVIGYKENVHYGEWSTPSKEVLTPSENLEVETENRQETITEKTPWSEESTTKPSAKEGREIISRSVQQPYKTTSCKNVTTTYTKNVTDWDTNAIRCSNVSFRNYVCTYKKTEKKCTTQTKYKTVTYYQYQDTTTRVVDTTYYTAREVIKGEPSYTGYILESEMPEGYQKLAGSERIQYRYRERCSK